MTLGAQPSCSSHCANAKPIPFPICPYSVNSSSNNPTSTNARVSRPIKAVAGLIENVFVTPAVKPARRSEPVVRDSSKASSVSLSELILAPLNSMSLPAPIATSTSPKSNVRIILSEAVISSSAIITPDGGVSLAGAVNLTTPPETSILPKAAGSIAGPAATILIVPPDVRYKKVQYLEHQENHR